jgi:glycosyltransferase involved in cell wall biosynthesis
MTLGIKKIGSERARVFSTKDECPLVSVTLASYNVGQFLNACLESVLAQTYRNFELIAVDDASDDCSRDILRQYAAQDSRIRLILKEKNEGLSVARNEGIAAARGEFVMFCDADDMYDPQMLELAVASALRESADLVIWDYVVFDNPETIVSKRLEPSGLRFLAFHDRAALLARPAFAWTKLVRRDVLHRFGIFFPRGLTYQDVPVHWELLTQVERISLVPHRLAFYRQQSAATTAKNGMRRADYFAVLDMVQKYLENNGIIDKYRDILFQTQLNAWHGVYDIIDKKHRVTVLAMIKQRLTPGHVAYVKSGKPLRWRARQFYRAQTGDIFASSLLAVWSAIRIVVRTLRVPLRRGSL